MWTRGHTAPRIALVATGLMLLAYTVALALGTPGDPSLVLVDNLVTTAAAFGGAGCCVATGLKAHGRTRAAWWLLGLSAASWGAGQAHWSFSELVLVRAVPFPSVADAGFLGFPVLAVAGLWLLAGQAVTSTSRLRVGLDGALVAVGAFTVSWTTVLASILSEGADGAFALAISVAYPVGDVLLVAMSLLLLSRVSIRRPYMVLLLLAPIAMTFADTGFAYLTTAGTYQTGGLSDLGWVLAFVMLGAAAVMEHASPTEASVAAVSGAPSSWLGLLLPYLPVIAGILLVTRQTLIGGGDPAAALAATLLVLLVLARQGLTVAENRHLLVELGIRHVEMREIAFHDPLTGLPNRLMFTTRLREAVQEAEAAGARMRVVYCDVDGFKEVNDRFGHIAGDQLLTAVAGRLRSAVRGGDTLARLGGDEFAVVLRHRDHLRGTHPEVDGAEDDERVRVRLQQAVVGDYALAGTPGVVPVRVSIGVAGMVPDGGLEAAAETLMRTADQAMYADKTTHRVAAAARA